MKRFFCAAFFVAVVALLAACGALNVNSAAAQATATPTSSTSRTQKSDFTAQSSASPTATAAPAQVETPATGDFPVVYLAGVVGLILICSAGLLMLRKI